jgi:ankyrin repeat protein
MLACHNGDTNIVSLLLEKEDIDCSLTNSNNDNCIDIAQAVNNDEIVTNLLCYISSKDT